ncbi:MAG: fibronectin type III domain-containing protein [Verrucomicrobiota bacterium]
MKLTRFLTVGSLGCLSLTASAQTRIAFTVPAGQAGTQNFGNALANEFDVLNSITLTKLGCFDDLSDGISSPITVRLYDRGNTAAPLLEMVFPPDDPATAAVREDGVLAGGNRMLPLASPLTLPAGFQGSIVASGYGSGDRIGNIGGVRPWGTDNGGGVISFAGRRSYWGDTAADYPGHLDQATGQYTAGTFEYQAVSPVLLPASPKASVTEGNGMVKLAWPAVTAPAAAAKYRVQRAAALDGPFTQIAETTDLNYTDSGLTNGTTYFYRVISLTAANGESQNPRVLRATPYQLAANRHIAYYTPGSTEGNQVFAGALGMDFDVQNPVIITRLGVFDAQSDGLQPTRDPGADGIPGNADDGFTSRTITASIYDRDNSAAPPVATMTFTTEEPGTLIGAMRFKVLSAPVTLPLGFKGSIVADGYGPGEPFVNSYNSRANAAWSLDNGNSSILFTGAGRYGDSPGSYPETLAASLADTYAAGTFEFETTAGVAPGQPAARLSPGIEDAAATLVWPAVTSPAPAHHYDIYRNDGDEAAPLYILVGTTTTLSHRITGLTNGGTYRYVVRGVTANGTESLPSVTLTATPHPIAAGVAYTVHEGTGGNQAYGGSVGMDFNAAVPLKVTRLGAFDADGNGLKLPISVTLYDRTSGAVIAGPLTFPVDDPATAAREDGELIGGSRFLPLPATVDLPEGFQGVIAASGYGAAELLANRAGDWISSPAAPLLFVGSGRYGDPVNTMPAIVDAGRSARFAAGNFEYQINGVILPGPIRPVLKGGNGQVQLSWQPATQPVPAASYRVLRAASSAGPFTVVANNLTATSHTDSGLTNGVTWFYKVNGVTAGGVEGASQAFACAPYQLAAGNHIAYNTPGSTPGNVRDGINAPTARGMDFDVLNAVTVTRLGYFDSLSDGIQPDPGADRIPGNEDDVPRSITIYLFDRNNPSVPAASLSFTTEDPGVLIEGMRFKPLPAPLALPAGFLGGIVSEGYGVGEPFRTAAGVPANVVWTVDKGNNSLDFTGTGRFGDPSGTLPAGIAAGTVAANYAAGTFEFQTTATTAPGKPVVRQSVPLENGAVSLEWAAVTTPVAAARYKIYRYDAAAGTYSFVADTAGLGLRITGLTNGEAISFVVRAVTSGGTEGIGSEPVTSTPAALASGIAYVVPDFTTGTQANFGGSLGMDFEVVHPVRVTRLGAFDSGADGLFLPISVTIYDRVTGQMVTPLTVFPADNPETPGREDGELVGGSRFMNLATPVELPAGFKGCIVAFGYGTGEPNGNSANGGWTTFNGGSLLFTGSSRYGVATNVMPATPDTSPANRYAAGTFHFEPASGTTVTVFDAQLAITPVPGNQVRITWTATPDAVLQRSATMTAGSWVNVPGAVSGFQTAVSGREFFRLIKP